MTAKDRLARSQDVAKKVGVVLKKRTEGATEQYLRRVTEAVKPKGAEPAGALPVPPNPLELFRYAQDVAQRSGAVLGHPAPARQPLHRAHERRACRRCCTSTTRSCSTAARSSGRSTTRCVQHHAARGRRRSIAKQRPYVIIDPRAGHGPGIGGFKDDSQVGVALQRRPSGLLRHLLPRPGAGPDDARRVRRRSSASSSKVRALHPKQRQAGDRRQLPGRVGGDDAGRRRAPTTPARSSSTARRCRTGAAPGAKARATTRCAMPAACSAASWLASLAADLGNGKFDGAHLVQNFENLNPANSLWDKYYHVFDKVDTEPPRFLDFERWWGGYYLMNTRRDRVDHAEPLRRQQALVGRRPGRRAARRWTCARSRRRSSCSPRWATTSRRRSRPSTGSPTSTAAPTRSRRAARSSSACVHEDIGHLGIFVSGKVATKEHAQIVSVLKTIERLPPGLYGMDIKERKGTRRPARLRGRVPTSVASRTSSRVINRFERADEQAVRGGRLGLRIQPARLRGVRPPVREGDRRTSTTRQAGARFPSAALAELGLLGELNPWLSWLAPAAEAIKAHRQAVADDHPLRQAEHAGAEVDQRLARLLPRPARRDDRGQLLQRLRQRVLAAHRRRSRRRAAARRARRARSDVRRRWPRSRAAATSRRWRAPRS